MKKEIRNEILKVASNSNHLLQTQRKEEIKNIFESASSKDALCSTITTLKIPDKDIDIIYRKLNFNYFKNRGIELYENTETKFGYCEDNQSVELIDYYSSPENIFVIIRHHLKQIKINSKEFNTDFNTFVFIDVMSDIFFYTSGKPQKIVTYKTNLSISDAEKTLLSKEFRISADLKNREYELYLTSFKAPIVYTMDHLDESLKQLYLLLGQKNPEYYKNYDNYLQMQTNFVKIIPEKRNLYHNIYINGYYYAGNVCINEELKKYEITFSLDNITVKIFLYLTDLDVKQKIFLTKEHLKNAILSENDQAIQDYVHPINPYKEFYYMYTSFCNNVIMKENLFQKIVIAFSHYITYKFVDYEEKLLKDTFGKIVFEKINVTIDDTPQKESYCGEIKTNIIQFKNNQLENENYFVLKYKEKFYIIKITFIYSSMVYENSRFKIALPVFIADDTANVCIKCITTYEELIDFMDNPSITFNFSKFVNLGKRNHIDIEAFIKSHFKDFRIMKQAELQSNSLEFLDSNINKIYSNLIDSVSKCDSVDSILSIDSCITFGNCDNYPNYKRLQLSSNNISYGYYQYNPNINIRLNTSMKNISNLPYSSSNIDDLIFTTIDESSLGFSTSLYELFKAPDILSTFKIQTVTSYDSEFSLFEKCIKKILEENTNK